MEKKLPMDIIESVLAEGMTEEEELEIAKRFIKKYEVRSKNQAEKAKAARKLAAKGFRGSVVSKLIF
jgi:SOS response regulatory protein OraA/RecX